MSDLLPREIELDCSFFNFLGERIFGFVVATIRQLQAYSSSGCKPSRRNRSISLSFPGLPAVSKTSPTKMELAPAKKHRACISSVMAVRPAERRTYDFAIMILASAMVRTKSIGSIGAAFASGVPAIGISMLMGTLSGGSGRLG